MSPLVGYCYLFWSFSGLQVYWTNGAQITTPHTTGIQRCILKNLKPKKDSWNQHVLCSNDLLSNPFEEILVAYFQSLKSQLITPFLEVPQKYPLDHIYTAMNGVGYPFVKLAFSTNDFGPVIPLANQVSPDPEFPSTPVLRVSVASAERQATLKKADIILANDPDAGCFAAAEVVRRKYKVFNFNELGALFGWWALETYVMREEDPDVSNCVMIASNVSSKILKSMAEVEGFTFLETLSGFNWIGNKVAEEQNNGRDVLFAFDELFGFMLSAKVLDRDGISAAAHLASMASYLRSERNIKLQDKLNEIYNNYGYHTSKVSQHLFHNRRTVNQIFHRLRTFDNGQKNTYPTSIMDGEFQIVSVRDLKTGYDSGENDKQADLPSSKANEMITFTFSNGFVITLRASKTEPMITYYAEICGQPENKMWSELTCTLEQMVRAVVNEFYEPEKNGLRSSKPDPGNLSKVCMYAV